jgi:predicted metalloprotease with PDZ domain
MTRKTSARAASLSAAVAVLLFCGVSWAQPARRPAAASPPAPEPISYTLRFPAPQTHYVEVEAHVPTGKAVSVDLVMPVWTPGSYLVREYSRNVENVTATAPDGRALAVEKTRKNHWKITTGGAPSIVLRYKVYQRFMAVQGGWVEADFAMLNGAPTFITLAERGPRPHDVKLELPAAWATTSTGLPAAPGGAPHHYLATDYDTLVDCPIVAGNQAVYEFTVGGKPHALVNVGEGGIWDGPRSARDAEKIVRANEKLWGSLPYEKYVFLNMLLDAGGGLEHKSSTLLLSSRWRGSTRQGYLGWLGLVSHEYFHAWNVKLLRPVELGPFDYDNENYTTGLWISEGFTDYYGDLMLPRAGLATRDEFLTSLGQSIQQLQTTPGRLVQSASMASFDS